MEKIVREVQGSRQVGVVYKDEDGYTYWKKRECKLHFTVRCASWKSGCKAKGKIMKNDLSKVIILVGHETHPANGLMIHDFKNICYKRSQNERTSLRIIYNETCAMAKFISVHVGSFLSHKRSMQRYRRRNQPTNPITLQEFHEQLIGEYSHLVTINDEPLYSGLVSNTEEEGVTLLFVLPGVKDILKNSKIFLMDGTFSAAPSFNNECRQLYVIMGITFNTGFPIAFALMSRKTTRAYAAVFEKLLSIEPQWKPETVIIDFELAAMAGIQFIFPGISVRGCWFHSSQAIWRKIGNLGMTELCTTDRGAYDIVHMIMALPLIPGNKIIEGFTSIQINYNENIKQTLSNESKDQFEKLFHYYKTIWITGVYANMLSVSGAVWRTNNVLEVSHQHLKMHIGNNHQPEPWVFLNALKTYCTGVRNDYDVAIDGGFIREPQRRVWIENQRKLDLAMRLFNEGRYTIIEFLTTTRHVTPTFGVSRPQVVHNITTNTEPPPFASTSQTELQLQQSVNLPQHQTNHSLSNSLPLPANPVNSTNQHDQPVDDHQNNHLALQARARELLIQRRVNGAEITILDLIHGIDDDEVATPPERFYVTRQDLNFLPLIEPKCYICLYSPSTVIASPCNHQGLCQPCFESYITMAPYSNIPYYRCALCRAEVEFYMILN